MSTLEFWLYLPQMRMSMEQMVERAQAAEAAGFEGIAGMDHLAPPGAERTPMFEAMVTNAWLAAHTDRLKVGSLVLCDSFRDPVMLARECVSLDHASKGRFELGIGWGSVTAEMQTYGLGSLEPRQRVGRLKESLEVVQALWTGEPVDYQGAYFTLRGAQMQPTPLTSIPILVGGAGPTTMQLVAAHADWWNVHIAIMDRFDEMRPRAGDARVSLQVQTTFVRQSDDRADVERTARRRFGDRIVTGDAPELVDRFGSLHTTKDVERLYIWFTDFAPPDTLAEFGETVIAALR